MAKCVAVLTQETGYAMLLMASQLHERHRLLGLLGLRLLQVEEVPGLLLKRQQCLFALLAFFLFKDFGLLLQECVLLP
jgi:hypothetical protein